MALSICFSLFSGVLFFLSFPPAGLNFLIWIFLVPLFYACSEKSSKGFFYGFLAGLSGFCLNLYWIYPTVRGAGESFLVSFGALFLLSAVLSFFPAVFTLSFRGSSLFVAASGTLLSYLRGIILTGLPWCALYVSQAKSPLFLQITGLAGPHFLTFVIIFFNHSLFRAVKKRERRYVIYALSVFLFTAVFGIVRISRTVEAVEKKIFIGQLNIPQDIKWDSASGGFIMERIRTFVLSSKGADLVVFPESCLPGVLNYDRYVNRFLEDMKKETDSPVLFGAAVFMNGKLYNTALLLEPRGKEQFYLKRKLVPFGEFVPFKNFFSRFVNVLNEVGDFTPGTAPGLLKTEGLSVAPLICNEVIFPYLWRGAGNLIVNISNNAWYGKTSAAEQHLWHASAAAAATGLPVIFANNRGPSAFIDARGRVLKKTEMFSCELVSCEVQIPAKASFYQRTGDLFILLILIFMIAAVLKEIGKNGVTSIFYFCINKKK
ncbi:MAG: apolipoprotein N-acyltransferase [bacterium]